MTKNNELPNRRSVRFPDYDYTQPGAYFITIVTLNRACIFGEVSEGMVLLTPLGNIVAYEWQRLNIRFAHIQLGEWVVMPNHLHGIINLIDRHPGISFAKETNKENDRSSHESFGVPIKGSIPTIIRSFKSSVTRRYQEISRNHLGKIWHRNYYEHIIRNENDLKRIHEYIEDNPRKWEEDEEFPRQSGVRNI